MAAPFTPDPADTPSGQRPAGDAPAVPTINHKLSQDLQGATPLAAPTPADFDPPTVISSLRPKRGSFDARLGETLAGRKLGHFELIESVGAGGMGAVLKARDLDLGRVVALKILPPDMAADPENIIRFKQEARAAAKLDHDNVARVYHFGEDQGLHYIAFEFVEGDNLRQMMEANGGTIPVADAVALMLEVAAGLGHAAERGVVHRDIKPSNIIVTPDGRAKIVDMGLARSMDARHGGQLTESGVTLGTFDYISPEQAIEPRQADVRSDIYSLGCTFYHALTGRTPVPDGTAAKKLDAQRNLLAPDPRLYNPAIPEDLAAVLGRMMAKDPDRRYQDPEHLAVHLRAVARKLGIATGPLSSPGSKFDEGPLPPPPRMNGAWVLTAVAVLALAIVIISDAFRPNAAPPILEEKTGAFQTDPIDPGPIAPTPVSVGQGDAANTEELLALLRQGTQHIRLTGRAYDLARYRDHDGQPVEAVLAGEDVRLEGVFEPVVRLGYSPDGKARVKTLTLRGSGAGKGSASVRGIHFLLPSADGDEADAGLLVTGFENVNLDECTFSTEYRSSRDGPAGLGLVLRGGSATVSKCYFAPGCVGFWIDGRGKVSVHECAIASQIAGIRVLRSSTDLTGETELTLTHCSALLPATGALVEVGDLVPCSIVASYCLFAGPDRQGSDDIPVVVRQRKTRAATTKYDGESDSRPNFYHNMAAYSEREETYSFADAAKHKLPIRDVERAIKHPWEDPDPFGLLKTSPPVPKRAFTQNLRLAELRIKSDPKRAIVGAKFLGPEKLFVLPLRSPESEVRDQTVKVWDPSLSDTSDNLPPGVFPTLAKALAAVGHRGTLLIRHNGRLEVEPCEFTKAETKLIIKPDAGFKPILVPAAVALKPAAGLFKLYGGHLVLDGLHFRLPADRAPAIVVLPGGGQFELKNAVITLEDGEDLAAVKLIGPRGEMMMGGGASSLVPKVTVENVFLRGKGHLVAVKGSRPFELDVKNVLAALDDTLIEIEPSSADPSSAGSGVVRLSRVTAYLGGSLLHFRASDKKTEMGPTGLARTEIEATQCVFVPAGGTPEAFVRADRIDTREQAEKWLSYRGKNNVYGHDKKKVMLEIRPTNIEAMPIQPIEGDRWLAMTLEEGDPFANVSFGFELPEARQTRKFLAVRPNDFRTIRFDPLRENSSDVGSTSEIASPFADE